MSVQISIPMSMCISIRMSVQMSIPMSIPMSIRMTIPMFIPMSTCMSICMSICKSAHSLCTCLGAHSRRMHVAAWVGDMRLHDGSANRGRAEVAEGAEVAVRDERHSRPILSCMADIVMTRIGMAYIVMTRICMAYVVMAFAAQIGLPRSIFAMRVAYK